MRVRSFPRRTNADKRNDDKLQKLDARSVNLAMAGKPRNVVLAARSLAFPDREIPLGMI